MFYAYINFHLHLHGDAVKGGTYNISKNIKIKFVEQSKIAFSHINAYILCLSNTRLLASLLAAASTK